MSNYTGQEIAVIGMSGKFPMAENLEAFWDNLTKGKECIKFFLDNELIALGTPPDVLTKSNFIKAEGFLENREFFDANFFGYTPVEAELMDPQMRIFYECCWEALENSGYNPYKYDGSIGLYAGASNNFYWEILSNMSSKGDELGICNASHLTDKDFLATRISYKLNLNGPSVSVQTACSTSLSAIHIACQSILNGECNIALAGGVTIWVQPIGAGYLYEAGTILSSDGHCKAFDAASDGTVSGNGAGVVVLKALDQAIEDGDHIFAVIKGSALNNDGVDKANYAAPSRQGQSLAIRMAQLVAEVEPESISYIEAHGTGTNIGDPIEIEALKKAFNSSKKQFCAIGSVKPNIGHLDSAAGVASFIKTVLALQNKQIPPSINFKTPNPKIDFANSPFYVNTELREWKRNGHPLRAGVSSFGVGGTNAHVVLEEAPLIKNQENDANEKLLVFSAKSEKTLNKTIENYSKFLYGRNDLNLSDVAYTLQLGRNSFSHRAMFVASNYDEVLQSLSSNNFKHGFVKENEKQKIVFLFSGQGSQYINMGKELYTQMPIFKEEIDNCLRIYYSYSKVDLSKILFSETGNDLIDQTQYAQPILFSFEYALAKLLISMEVKPDAMVGHSIGEYVSACIAGTISLEDAINLVYHRGRLMQECPNGSMLGVNISEGELRKLLNGSLTIACVNSTTYCVVSGESNKIEEFQSSLNQRGIHSTLLYTSHAFHSPMMVSAIDPFQNVLKNVAFKNPKIPFLSNYYGKWAELDMINSKYWTDQLLGTVKFSDGLTMLLNDEKTIFIEVGPGKSLLSFTELHDKKTDKHTLIQLVKHPNDKVSDCRQFLNSLGSLWVNGLDVKWDSLHANKNRKRTPLPTYPFDRQRFWIDSRFDDIKESKGLRTSCCQPQSIAGLYKKEDIGDWFYVPEWEKNLSETNHLKNGNTYLVFNDKLGFSDRVIKHLIEYGKTVIAVDFGMSFRCIDNFKYVINPSNEEDYSILFSSLKENKMLPNAILHFSSLSLLQNRTAQIEETENTKKHGLYSFMNICKALGNNGISTDIDIEIVTNGIFEVTGNDYIYPEKSTILGPVKVVPLEYSNIKVRCIDIDVSDFSDSYFQNLTRRLTFVFEESVFALRGKYLWKQKFTPLYLNESKNQLIKQEGVYIIFGGRGGIGFNIAKHLARKYKAKVVIVSRNSFPKKEVWENYIENNNDAVSVQIKEMQQLELQGASFFIEKADIADYHQVKECIDRVYSLHGTINGVVHSAGIIDYSGIIQRRNIKQTDEVLCSKVIGVQLLEKIFQDIKLDFIALFSSIGNITYELKFGQVGYNAANEFLDAYSYLNNKTFVSAINWTDWTEVGMTHRTMTEEDKKLVASAGLKPDEGVEVFDRIINNQISHAIVMPADIKKVKELIKPNSIKEIKESVEVKKGGYDRPNLSTKLAIARDELEEALVAIWEDSFGYKNLGIDDNFFELGGDSLKGMRFVNRYKELLNEIVHVSVVFEATTIRDLSNYFRKYYPEAVSAIFDKKEIVANTSHKKLDDSSIATFKKMIPGVSQSRDDLFIETPAVFILSPPRSGSTLLRVMLAGNPSLFSPPEISLIQYGNLSEISDNNPAIQGAVRTIMQLKNCDREEASTIFNKFREDRTDVISFFKSLSEWSDNKVFVHKSPGYSYSLEILNKILYHFKNVKFIHLLRHPYGMINSFEEAKMDLLVGRELVEKIGFERKEIAELIWTISQNNINLFLSNLPKDKFIQIKFEDLVSQPEELSKKISGFLGVDYHQDMISPYKDKKELMTDGTSDVGIMMGDVKFHSHSTIEKDVASAWKSKYLKDFLGEPTMKLSKQFNYELIEEINSNLSKTSKIEYYPTSPQQKRLYDRYVSAKTEFEKLGDHFIQVFIIEGELEKDKVIQAAQELVNRHEAYRSSYEIVDGELVYKVIGNVKARVVFCEAEDNDASVREAIDKYVQSFNLNVPPLMEILLVKVASQKHFVVINTNHMISDGASQIIVVDEMGSMLLGNKLNPVTVQYRDYVKWFYSAENQKDLQEQRKYWLNEFSNIQIPQITLPVDFERTSDKGKYGFSPFLKLDKETTKKLKEYIKRERVSVYIFLLTAYFVLLSKLSKQDEIVVGTSVSGRKEKFNSVIGFFLNLLPIYKKIEPSQTFNELLHDISQRVIKSIDNKEYQFEELLEDLKIENDPLRHPVFNAFFHYINHDFNRNESENKDNVEWKLIEYGYEGKAAKYELELVIRDEGETILNYLIYRSNLFKRETINEFASEYIKIVKDAINN